MGYRNLVTGLHAHLDGFHYRRIDKELLASHSASLIGLSGCLKEKLTWRSVGQSGQGAPERGEFRDIWSGKFLLEMHDHGIEAQHKCNQLPHSRANSGLG
jgi:DNA polymerase III alpha subunit